jgi:L,D-transpeptidase ErfK/SrfK
MMRVLVHIMSFVFALSTFSHASSVIEPKSKFPKISGEIRTTITTGNETLMEVARREGFGYEMLANSNRFVDPWNPKSGTKIILPGKVIVPYGSKTGLTINLAELRLFHIMNLKDGNYQINIYPLGIGREGRWTPEGNFRIIVKKEHPQWQVPIGLRKQDPSLPQVMSTGPLNPLGDYWLGLSEIGYGIHGTNQPFGVGRRVSYGCMRMYPQDIVTLYAQVEIGTPVRINYQPVKATSNGDNLLLEVHPDYLGRFGDLFQHALNMISKTGWSGMVDYAKVQDVVRAQGSIPEIIGHRSDE